MNSQRRVKPRIKLRLGESSTRCFFGLGARMLEQLGVIHARRTRRHAREATEAEIHFVGERFRRFQPAVRDGAHERDAPARAVAFEFGGVVSRARRQAKAAVHALLHDRVIEVFEMRAMERLVHRICGSIFRIAVADLKIQSVAPDLTLR